MALICEFMAPMGAGKSTLIREICSDNPWKDIRIASETELKREKYNLLKWFRKSEPVGIARSESYRNQIGLKYKTFPLLFLDSLMKNKLDKNGFNYIYKRFYRGIDNIAKIEYFRSLTNVDLFLIEDNFIRYSDILEVSSLSQDEMRLFSSITPLPDLIVYMELDIDINLDRLVKRTQSMLNRKLLKNEIDERFNTLEMLNNLHKEYFRFLVQEYKIKFIKIDASRELFQNKNKILDFIREDFLKIKE